MQIREIMTDDVRVLAPSDNLVVAAELMSKQDTGAVLVGEDDRLIGMVTDRDITLRAVAKDRQPSQCPVSEVMSRDVKYVYEDETIEDLVRNMSHLKVRRLPVLNRDKRLVGVVSLGDIAYRHGGKAAEHAVRELSEPDRLQHSNRMTP